MPESPYVEFPGFRGHCKSKPGKGRRVDQCPRDRQRAPLGISLFLVPKFIADGAGTLCARIYLRCILSTKLGRSRSPTCTINFGDEGRCVGWLIGSEHAGMRAMFPMMNVARINVGLEGIAIAERAYQGALAYAHERVRSAPIGGNIPVRIIEHPDVRCVLITLLATTQAFKR
jgi:3-(methylthio)propanoyl-CoA dehydrogenase